MMRTIHLHGRLKKQFGAKHRFEVATAAEGLRALNCAFPRDFVAALREGSFKVVRGDKMKGMVLDISLVNELNLGQADFHLIPVAAGAANGKGTVKTILGVVLIGSAIFLSGGSLAAPLGAMGDTAFKVAGMAVSWGNIATVGLGVMLAGASTLLAGASGDTAQDTKKDDSSHMLNGPGQIPSQGAAIPLIYGECLVTPVDISVDADIEDIGAYKGSTGSMSTWIPPGWNPVPVIS